MRKRESDLRVHVIKQDVHLVFISPYFKKETYRLARKYHIDLVPTWLLAKLASETIHILKSLAESPKSFTEIKELLDTTSATTNFHLKTLIKGTIVYKDENGRYALTLLGELLLDYFSRFLEEANRLHRAIDLRKDLPKG